MLFFAGIIIFSIALHALLAKLMNMFGDPVAFWGRILRCFWFHGFYLLKRVAQRAFEIRGRSMASSEFDFNITLQNRGSNYV